MSCGEEEYKKITGQEPIDPQITEEYIDELETAFKDAQPKPLYSTIQTKVWKGRLAPQGKLFFGVKVKSGKGTYTNVVLLDCSGREPELEQELYKNLYLVLAKKYKLGGNTVEDHKTDVEAKANKHIPK